MLRPKVAWILIGINLYSGIDASAAVEGAMIKVRLAKNVIEAINHGIGQFYALIMVITRHRLFSLSLMY